MRLWKPAPRPADAPVAPVAHPSELTEQAAARGLSDDARQRIHATSLFDAADYAARAGLPAAHPDLLAHYVAVGEPAGVAPSSGFDPGYYAGQYPDIGPSGGSPLVHYVLYGAAEGRQALPRLQSLSLPPVDAAGRPVVLLVMHEASQTGAPILGWNLARQLQERAAVVAVLLKPGKLAAAFGEVCAAVVGPIGQEVHEAHEIRLIAAALVAQYRPAYAILNSVEARYIAEGLHEAGLPFLALVHEFASYAKPAGSLGFLYRHALATVFPAEMVRQSSLRAYPALADRPTLVLPQGPTAVPLAAAADQGGAIRAQLRPAGAQDRFLVVGLGPVAWRKGADLFAATAASLFRRWPDAKVRFVWVGASPAGAEPSECETYFAEQLERNHLGDRFAVMAAVDQVEPVYAEADLLLLSSRLDPLPNVAIDAALRGLPMVCFAEASGVADMLLADPATQGWVVPYLDTGEAARAVHALYEDRAATARAASGMQARARSIFDLDGYAARLHKLGLEPTAAPDKG